MWGRCRVTGGTWAASQEGDSRCGCRSRRAHEGSHGCAGRAAAGSSRERAAALLLWCAVLWCAMPFRAVSAAAAAAAAAAGLQDNVLIHVAKNNPENKPLPTIIGSAVTIGHGATIHAATIQVGSALGGQRCGRGVRETRGWCAAKCPRLWRPPAACLILPVLKPPAAPLPVVPAAPAGRCRGWHGRHSDGRRGGGEGGDCGRGGTSAPRCGHPHRPDLGRQPCQVRAIAGGRWGGWQAGGHGHPCRCLLLCLLLPLASNLGWLRWWCCWPCTCGREARWQLPHAHAAASSSLPL